MNAGELIGLAEGCGEVAKATSKSGMGKILLIIHVLISVSVAGLPKEFSALVSLPGKQFVRVVFRS